MITRRMRHRRRLLDAYMRVERQEQGAHLSERPAGSQEGPLHPRLMAETSPPLTSTTPSPRL
jgi:hypothetical protein